MNKYLFDKTFSIFGIIICLPLFFLIATAIFITSKGPIIHWSKRVGKNNSLFYMPKFRTMVIGAPNLATHLIENPNTYITKVGSFLRKTSLDELPQLYSIVRGDMSFVGPRPALFNQYDLIELRNELDIQNLLPGLTGLAQIYGRDILKIEEKVKFDHIYLQNRSFIYDLKILMLTFFRVLNKEGILH